MAQLDFFNHNVHRAYPLVESEHSPPYDNLLAYCRFIVRPEAKYRPDKHSMYLYGIRRSTSVFTSTINSSVVIPGGTAAVFISDCPGLSNLAVIAYVVGNPKKYHTAICVTVTKTVANELLGIPGPVGPVIKTHLIEGTVVFGDLPQVTAASTLVLANRLRVEPALVLPVPEYAAGPGYGLVRVWNRKRTYYRHPGECGHLDTWEPGDYEYEEASPPISGPVRFQAGASITLSQDIRQGTITVDASPGGGPVGFACDDIPVNAQEEEQEGNLDLAVTCQEVMRTLNGAQGPDVNITPGNGVQIASYTAANRIIIGIGSGPGDSCPEFDPVDQVECLPYQDGQPCGPEGVPSPCPDEPDNGVGYKEKSPGSGNNDSPTGTTAPPTSGNDTPTSTGPCTGKSGWVWRNSQWDLFFQDCGSPCQPRIPSQPPVNPQTLLPAPENTELWLGCNECPIGDYFVRNSDLIIAEGRGYTPPTPTENLDYFPNDFQYLPCWDVVPTAYMLPAPVNFHATYQDMHGTDHGHDQHKVAPEDFPFVSFFTPSYSNYSGAPRDEYPQIIQKRVHLLRGVRYKPVLDALVVSGYMLFEIEENGVVVYSKRIDVNSRMQSIELSDYVCTSSYPTLVISAREIFPSEYFRMYVARPGFIRMS